MKKHPKLYKETMTTEEVIQAVDSINTTMAAKKWLERHGISKYPVDARTSLWDRDQVMKVLGL